MTTSHESRNDASDAIAIEGISRNGLGQIVVRLAGRSEPVVDARVCRCFPWSLPDQYISIRDKDGNEVVLLETLDALNGDWQTLLIEELRDKAFNPQIRKVLSHKTEFGVTSITAMTDRGEVIFQIRSREDVRVLSPRQALFRDADGNTYELADLNALDKTSRHHLSQYF
ncbi:MAG: DUF1854 domain-containing protein [Planctomycetaceae bacterium]|nr:DUF1854 domain-containing protein [Planctomycetaceae bacterium]